MKLHTRVHRCQVILRLIYIYHWMKYLNKNSLFDVSSFSVVVSARYLSANLPIYIRHWLNHVKQALWISISFFHLSIQLTSMKIYLPVAFKTFNDVGRFTCVRPRFSVVVEVGNIGDIAGVSFDESSCEWTAILFNSSSL